MTTLRPNYPLVTVNADFTQGPPNVPGVSAMSLDSPARRTTVREIDITRGRQYELDQVQAGTCDLTITDPLEMLHPANTTSPFNTGGNTITSYRCMQVGAWWNPASGDLSGNLLNATNTPAGTTFPWDPSFESGPVASSTPTGVTATSVTTPADGGLPVTQIVTPDTTSMMVYGLRLVPGTTYVVVADVFATTGVTVAMGTLLNGVTTPGTNTTSTGSFQPLSMTITAVAGQSLYFAVTAATGGFPATFYVAGIRVVGLAPGWNVTGTATMRVTTTLTGGAHSGFYALNCGFSNATDTVTVTVPTAPGTVYTMSAWCNPLVAGSVGTMNIGAASTSTTTVNTWQRLALTFTATDAITTVTFTAPAGTYPVAMYVDDIQLEIASSASAFTTTGPTFYPLYTGYIERYPLRWDMSGTRGIRPLQAVDALSILSRAQISQSYRATILADNPVVFIPYDDMSMPQAVQLPSGGPPFLGYQSTGAEATVDFQGDTFLDGAPAVSLSQPNSDPATVGDTSHITYLGTRGGPVTMNSQAFTIEVWARISAGEPYFGAGSVPAGEPLDVEPFGPAFGIGWISFLGGKLGWTYQDPNGTSQDGFLPGVFTGYPDGQWHYYAIKLIGGNGLTAVIDDVIGGIATITPSASVALNNFYVDAQAYFGDPVTTISVANLACYPYALSNEQLLEHFKRGTGFLNELSGARVKRLLSQYWGGAVNVAAGTRKMAPDNALGGNDYNSRFILDVLQEIQETERGMVYADAAGVVQFEDSTSRYTKNLSSRWTFGENPPGANPAEYPYQDLQEDFDPTFTFSQTNLTRPGNQSFQPLPNPLPTNPPYGQRVLTQEVQVNDDFDLVQASTFYLKQYGKPTIRVDQLTLNPAANPALWPVVLSLEISQRITVKRRTSAGLVTTADYYIEQVNHSINGTDGTWLVQLQCSPVFNNSAWILGDPTYGVLGSTTIPVY